MVRSLRRSRFKSVTGRAIGWRPASRPHNGRQKNSVKNMVPTEAPEDIRTIGAQAESQSRFTTWVRYHEQVSSLPVLPLTPAKMNDVVKKLKLDKYRSIPNMLSVVKRHHLERRFKWTELLRSTQAACRRFAVRGIGKSRKAKSFTWCKLCRAYGLRLPAKRCQIVKPAHVAAVSSRLLFRAAEIGALNKEDVQIHMPKPDDLHAKPSIVFTVSHSKTDAQARGCRLRLHCCCSQTWKSPGPEMLGCPVCCCIDYAMNIHNSLGPWPHQPLQFFVTSSGVRITAAMAANMLSALDAAIDLEDTEEEPFRDATAKAPVWGGHSFRRSGARGWFRAGLDVPSLKILGRWSSDTVERYIEGMIRDVCQPQLPVDTVFMVLFAQNLSTQLAELSKTIDHLKQHASLQHEGSPMLCSRRSGAGATAPSIVIMSERPQQEARSKLHLAPPLSGPSSMWKTFGCNYRFGPSKFGVYQLSDLPSLNVTRCKDCFAPPFFLEFSD